MRETEKVGEDIPVLSYNTAIAAMKEGAQEYVVKPCHPQEISMLVSRIIKVKNLQRENNAKWKKIAEEQKKAAEELKKRLPGGLPGLIPGGGGGEKKQ